MSVNAVTIGDKKAIVTPTFSNTGVATVNGRKKIVHKSGNSYSFLSPVAMPSQDFIFSNVVQELQPLASQLYAMSQANSAQSAEYAQDLRNWQYNMMQLQGDFNSSEAAKNRDWQQMMSNTAHQREVADLKAAGLNPVLSAMNGNGASVGSGATASVSAPSGAMGSVDTSANSAIVSLLASMLSAQTQLAGQALSAQTNQAIADKNNATSKLIAEMNRDVAEKQIEASLSNANLSYLASLYGADSSKFASIVGSQLGYDASVFASQMSSAASMYGSEMSAGASRYGTDVNAQLTKEYPNNPWRLLSSVGKSIAGAYGYDSVNDAVGSMVNAGTRAVERFLRYHTNLSDDKVDQIVGKVKHYANGETVYSPNGFRATRRNYGSFRDRVVKNLWNKVDRFSS